MQREEERRLPLPSAMVRDEAAAHADERVIQALELPRTLPLMRSCAEVQRMQRDEEQQVSETWSQQQRQRAEENAQQQQELALESHVTYWATKAAQSPAAYRLRAALHDIA